MCSLDVAFTVATVRNRPQPFATVRAIPVWPCLWEVLQRWSFLEVSDVSLLRFAWQAWHFVTFRRVVQRVENRFAWQAQYFCDVFRRCVAVFVAGAALWTCPTSILKLQSAKIGGSLVRNVRFGAQDVSRLASLVFPWLRRVYGGSCKTCPFVMLPIVKIAGSLARNDRFGAPTCLVSSLWFSCGIAVSMGEAGKPLLFECVQGCHVVLRGRRGTL